MHPDAPTLMEANDARITALLLAEQIARDEAKRHLKEVAQVADPPSTQANKMEKLRQGDFVSLKKPDEFERKTKDGAAIFNPEYVGLVLRIKKGVARVLWLSEGCGFSLHWDEDTLRRREANEVVTNTQLRKYFAKVADEMNSLYDTKFFLEESLNEAHKSHHDHIGPMDCGNY